MIIFLISILSKYQIEMSIKRERIGHKSRTNDTILELRDLKLVLYNKITKFYLEGGHYEAIF